MNVNPPPVLVTLESDPPNVAPLPPPPVSVNVGVPAVADAGVGDRDAGDDTGGVVDVGHRGGARAGAADGDNRRVDVAASAASNSEPSGRRRHFRLARAGPGRW